MRLARVGIDLTYLFPGRALGHQRVCEGLVAGWANLAQVRRLDWEPVLLSSEEARPLFERYGFAMPSTGILARSATRRVLAQNAKLPGTCRRERLDLLYCPGNSAPLFPGSPTVVTLHDLHHRQYRASHPFAKKVFSQVFAEPSLRRAARIVVPSRFTAEQAMKWLGLNTTVVPMSPQLPDHDTSSASSSDRGPQEAAVPVAPAVPLPAGPYFVSVSVTLPHKNVALLRRAFAAYRKLGGRHALVLVGSHALARGDDGIVVLDRIDDAGLRRLYEHAEGLISASEYEGFGLPLAEALALGCPVLAPRLASIPEVLGVDGHYFASLEPASMAHDLRRFEDATRLSLGAGPFGYRTWTDVAADYSRLFSEVIAR